MGSCYRANSRALHPETAKLTGIVDARRVAPMHGVEFFDHNQIAVSGWWNQGAAGRMCELGEKG